MMIVQSERVMLPAGMRPAAIHVQDGRVAAIAEHGAGSAGVPLVDVGDLVVLPGLVDTHVHVNDPGRDDWEGFEHATRAAAAGGVTTLIDMPLNSVPPTTSVDGLDAKLRAARGRSAVDVGFWGGVVPGNVASLDALAHRGVLGFKCFLAPSGVEEFEHVSEHDLRNALPAIAKLRLPLLVHAELASFFRTSHQDDEPRRYETWLDTRPPASEQAAIDLLIRLAREFRVHVHIVHLASADALPALDAARAAGVPVTVETCPHYLTFCAEEIPDGATAFKCAPPIRPRDHRERLWTALAADQIDLVASDHSPAPPALKHLDDGDFLRAWGGIASLQLGLAAVWTGAAARALPLERTVRWLSEAPARLAGLQHRKGAIAAGRDADLVVWDPDAETVVDPASLHHRHPVTPYASMPLRGAVRTTMLRGEVIFHEGRFTGSPQGRQLLATRPG